MPFFNFWEYKLKQSDIIPQKSFNQCLCLFQLQPIYMNFKFNVSFIKYKDGKKQLNWTVIIFLQNCKSSSRNNILEVKISSLAVKFASVDTDTNDKSCANRSYDTNNSMRTYCCWCHNIPLLLLLCLPWKGVEIFVLFCAELHKEILKGN